MLIKIRSDRNSAEVGWYYLNSRYYDPEVGRFISADGEISGVGGDIRGYNLYSYCFNNPVNMSDPDGNWPKWAKKAVAIAAVVAVVAVVAVTVATFGAGSIAGVAVISAAATFAAKATEVAVLQKRKSKKEGKSRKKTATNVVEAVYDNGAKIIGVTPFTKAAGIAFQHTLNVQVESIFNSSIALKDTLVMTGGKAVAYGFAGLAWANTTFAIFCDDSVKRAEERRYNLK